MSVAGYVPFRHVDLDVQSLGSRGDVRISDKTNITEADSAILSFQGSRSVVVDLLKDSAIFDLDYPYFVGQMLIITLRTCPATKSASFSPLEYHRFDADGNNVATLTGTGATLVLMGVDNGNQLDWRVAGSSGVTYSKLGRIFVDQPESVCGGLATQHDFAPTKVSQGGDTNAMTTSFSVEASGPGSMGTQALTSTIGFEAEIAE